MVVDGVVDHGPDQHLHTGSAQIADTVDDDESHGVVDGEEEQDAEHDGGKAGAHAAPLLLAELVGKRLGDGKGQHRVQHAQHAGDSLNFNVAEEVLIQVGVQTVDHGSTDHAGQAEEHNAQQSLIVRDLLEHVQVVQLFALRTLRHFHALLAPHAGDLQAQQAQHSADAGQHQEAASHGLVVHIQEQGADHDHDGHEDGAAKAAVAGQCGALADIIGHHAGQSTEGHVDAGVQRLVQNVGDEHVGQTQAVVDIAYIDKAKYAQHCHGEGEGADPRDELAALGGLAGVHQGTDDGVIHGVPDLGDQQQDTHVEGVDLQDQGVEDRQIHGAVLLGEAAAQIAQRIADLVLHGEGSDGLFLVHCVLSSLKTVKPRDFSHKSLFYVCIIR